MTLLDEVTQANEKFVSHLPADFIGISKLHK